MYRSDLSRARDEQHGRGGASGVPVCPCEDKFLGNGTASRDGIEHHHSTPTAPELSTAAKVVPMLAHGGGN